MTRFAVAAALAGIVFVTVAPHARQAPAAATAAPVELDVSVIDKDGMPITDMTKDEFDVQDDGKKVDITAMTTVAARGTRATGDGRELVLILDDAGVPAAGTSAIQQIATIYASNAGPGDHVSVIRLHKADDDIVAERQVALARIAGYQASVIPFFQDETPDDTIRLITKLAKRWNETLPHRRKAIVCIGSTAVCAPLERDSTAPRDMYPLWVNVVKEAARSNTIEYAAVPGRFTLTGGSLPERTGGDVLGGTTDFGPAVQRVMNDLSDYYMLTYTPAPSKKDTRGIVVKVKRKGATARTRNRRGN
jgi:hypothetical protein